MSESSFGFGKVLSDVDFQGAIDRVTEALKKEGFGVLTTIDVKATLKKKIDVDFRKYTILGACNPVLAHRALQIEPYIGLMLPCNVVVEEVEEGIKVFFVDPQAMMGVVNTPAMKDVANTAEAKLRNALAAL